MVTELYPEERPRAAEVESGQRLLKSAGSIETNRSEVRMSGISVRWAKALKWTALLALAAAALALAVVPMWILRPFSPQTPSLLRAAFELRRAAPPATLVALLVAAALAWSLWRTSRLGARAGMVVVVALVGGAAWLTRQNIFEMMFKPLPAPSYVDAAAAAGFVGVGDRVLAIEREGDAVAYPIRQMAYHHVVLDRVGGAAVAVTY
jgi:hypothetical protein